MDPSTNPPRRFAIGWQPTIKAAQQEAEKIARYLQERDLNVQVASIEQNGVHSSLEKGGYDLLIALGGDGTMLRAGQLCGPLGIPILGINLGHFGFLTEVSQNEWPEIMPRLLAGDYRLEDRMMLKAEHLRDDQVRGTYTALNEVVVCRGKVVRPIRLQALVDGYLLANYVADGLIVATPTGSTAYSLAVGGPILPPDLRNILITAVAPHLSVDRAVVLSEGSVVTIMARTNHQAVFSVDGHEPVELEDGDCVKVESIPESVHFVRFQDYGYFYRNLTNYMEQNPSTKNHHDRR